MIRLTFILQEYSERQKRRCWLTLRRATWPTRLRVFSRPAAAAAPWWHRPRRAILGYTRWTACCQSSPTWQGSACCVLNFFWKLIFFFIIFHLYIPKAKNCNLCRENLNSFLKSDVEIVDYCRYIQRRHQQVVISPELGTYGIFYFFNDKHNFFLHF